MAATGKWKPEMEEQVYRLALLGATAQQIADFYGVSKYIVDYWESNNPEYQRAARRGKTEADMKVVQALFRRATGYAYKEVTNYTRRNAETGEMEIIRQEIVEKHHSPDTYACLRWLSLRRRQEWAETTKATLDITYRGQMEIEMVQEQLKDPQLSTEELKLALKMGLTQIAQNATN